MPTFPNGETGLAAREKINNAITRTEFAVMLEDTSQLANLVYTTGSAFTVAAGAQVITAKEGFSYEVQASGATEFDLQPGAVKLNALPTAAGHYNFDCMLPAGDGVTDDWAKLRRLLDKQGQALPAFYRAGPSIYIPAKKYYMSQDLELKQTVRLFGDHIGYGSEVTGTLIFAPDSHGIVFNRFNTLNDGTVTGTIGGDWSSVEGLYLRGSGTDTTRHGIYMRSRGSIIGCQIRGFPGDGIHVNAAAGFGGAVEGNANLFVVSRTQCVGNGRNGFYCNGADANAGLIEMLDCRGNGRHGIYDSSFLGNTYIACHTQTNGTGTTSSSHVSYGGARYSANWRATEAQLVATEPGTNSAIWFPDPFGGGPVSGIPLWQAGQPEGTYFVAYSYFNDNLNSSAVFVGCYAESGAAGSVFLGPCVVIGGSLSTVYEGDRLRAGSNGTYTLNRLSTGDSAAAVNLTDGTGFFSFFYPGTSLPWRLQPSGNDLVFRNGNLGSRNAYFITGDAAAVPYKFSVSDFLLGGKRMMMGTAAPTTGTYAQGDYVRNSAPAVGQPKGWICTVAGTPGTWVSEGNL